MKEFLGVSIKMYGTTLLVISSMINIFIVGGGTGIVAALLNLTIIFSIWFPTE